MNKLQFPSEFQKGFISLWKWTLCKTHRIVIHDYQSYLHDNQYADEGSLLSLMKIFSF